MKACKMELTSAQKWLLDSIIDHEQTTGRFAGTPLPSHCGTSKLLGYDTGKTIAMGFQKRTFTELVDQGFLLQTMFCGYMINQEKLAKIIDRWI